MFKEKLGAISIKALTRNARERRPGSLGFAEAMIVEYNGRKKSGLHRLLMSKLYARENKFVAEEDTDGPAQDEDASLFDAEDDN